MVAIKERVSQGRQTVKEIIGRVVNGSNLWSIFRTTNNVDETTPDYFYWDRFRRAVIPGLKMASLFAKPAAEIKADWIVGEGFQVALAEENSNAAAVDYTNGLLGRLAQRIKGMMLTMVTDLKGLGDQYIVVNPDGSFSVPSPEMVKMDYTGMDYRVAERCTIRTKRENYEIVDEYRLDGRTITVTSNGTDRTILATLLADGWEVAGEKSVKQEYENLIGKLPVVHFANDRSANETHGRPMYEGLLHLFDRYDGISEKGMDAAEIMANPIPVFKLDDIDDAVDANAEPIDQLYTDESGTARARKRISFDRFATIMIKVNEAFEFVSPVRGFTDDLKSMLKLMFLLILEHLRIPEVVWGGELGQARASASEQMKTFYMHIAGQRLALEGMGGDDLLGLSAQGGIHELMDIWLRTRSLFDRQVIVAPVRVAWSALGEANDELNLKWAQALHQDGVITDETYVDMSGRIEDSTAEVENAKAQMTEKQDTFDAAVNAAADATDPVTQDPAA